VKHIAIIMDGNGRWAKERGLPRTAGHKAGMDRISELTRALAKQGTEALTLYAFSTENWKRPENEVSFLMKLPDLYLKRELKTLIKENVKLMRSGFDENVPASTLKVLDDAIEKTKNNTGITLNFAFNYGGRADIVNAAKQLMIKAMAGELSLEDVNEDIFAQHLLTGGLPDVDLLIRTSGEIRISNFLLWQIAYSEMIFSDTYFPDFDEKALLDCLTQYQLRARRFGALT
jgi:undecaprenyl diphosphate synthase